VTLRIAADEWLRYEEHEVKVKRSTVMDYRNCADRLCRDLGDIALEDITPQVVERWKAAFSAERRLAGGELRRTPPSPSPRTIRKYLVKSNCQMLWMGCMRTFRRRPSRAWWFRRP
jgi:hypothetical protein